MKDALLVGLGGCIGSIARYRLSGVVLHGTLDWRFPLGTFVVNVAGCLIAGILAGVIERHGVFSTSARLFLFTGVLGGFTTFSAFGLETTTLLRRGEIAVGSAYAASSVLFGVAAFWAGVTAVNPR
jgi:CrcB protein